MQETVTFSGTIIGAGQRVECEVRATRTTLAGDPPLVSGYWIVETEVTDGLPDGDYELLVNREELDSGATQDGSSSAHSNCSGADRLNDALKWFHLLGGTRSK